PVGRPGLRVDGARPGRRRRAARARRPARRVRAGRVEPGRGRDVRRRTGRCHTPRRRPRAAAQRASLSRRGAGLAYDDPVKYVVLVPDGCADEPLDELDGRTPLAAAAMPNLASLARRAEVGRACVIPPGMAPGSDVGNMAILGYDPAEFHTGRAPIEAAAMGVDLAPDEVAYRCNLVTIGDDGTMVDFAAGHPTDAQSHHVVAALDAALGAGRDGVRFHPGVEYRHLCVVPRDWADADCVPPHDLTGKLAVVPTGPAASRLVALMDASRDVVKPAAEDVGCAATQIWLWGQGERPALPRFDDRFGVTGRLSSAVDLVRGLGVLTGLEVVDVPGATAGFDNDYAAQTRARAVGHRSDRPDRRRARRRGVPHPPHARSRHAVRHQDAHERSRSLSALRLHRRRPGRRVHRSRRRRAPIGGRPPAHAEAPGDSLSDHDRA